MVWDLEAGSLVSEVTCGEYINAVCWAPEQEQDQSIQIQQSSLG
jgi:hypothetical protein